MNDARAVGGTAGAFAVAGDHWAFTGRLTFDDATAVLAAAAGLPLPSSGRVDMTDMAHADSAALAVLLALQRRAAGEGRKLAFAPLPSVLDTLARVYGIEDLLAQ